jgi:hypothetical protein
MTVLDAPTTTLDTLAETANREHELVLEAGTAMVAHAIKAGEALLKAKELVGHGGWEHWLVENIADKSLTTPRLYMRLARHRDQVLAAGPASLNVAQKLLIGGADSRVDQDRKDDARRLRKQGRTYQQIADELGCTRDSAYRWCNPKAEERARRRHQMQSMAGRRALNRQKRERAVRKAGGALAEAYSLIRKTLEALEQAETETQKREQRAHISSAMHRLYNAEDEIVKAVGLS